MGRELECITFHLLRGRGMGYPLQAIWRRASRLCLSSCGQRVSSWVSVARARCTMPVRGSGRGCALPRAAHGRSASPVRCAARRVGREKSGVAVLVSEQTRAAWTRAQRRTCGRRSLRSRADTDGALSRESDEQSSYFRDPVLGAGRWFEALLYFGGVRKYRTLEC